ncbi:MAG: hypothetical protein L3J68_00220 [Thermoplasmata archaeon]|nr:hypothetical protein [Thermoplasmata archaeon]
MGRVVQPDSCVDAEVEIEPHSLERLALSSLSPEFLQALNIGIGGQVIDGAVPDRALEGEVCHSGFDTVAKDRGTLSELADDVRKAAELPIFPFRGNLPTEEAVTWSGEDATEFLTLAKKIGAKVLYLNEAIVGQGDENPERAKHVGETWLVELAFLFDGEFHVLLKTAEWAGIDEEEADEQPNTDNSGALETLTTRKDEFVQEFVAGMKQRPGPLETSRFSIEQGFRRFLSTKLELPAPAAGLFPGVPHDGSPLDLLVQKIADDLSMDLSASLAEEERTRIEPLVAECVAWAEERGLTRLSMGDVEVFLDEKRIRVSRAAVRLLCNRAKVALRTAKR